MKRILFSLILALSLALPAAAQVVEDPSTGASISSGSTISGCNAITAILNVVTGALTCNPASVVNGTVSTAGRSILTIRDTISGASLTSNFLNVTGTLPASLSQNGIGAYFTLASGGDAGNSDDYGIYSTVGGTTGASGKVAVSVYGSTTATGGAGNSIGTAGESYFSDNSKKQWGLYGHANATNGNSGSVVGVFGLGAANSGTPTTNIGVWGESAAAGTNKIGGFFRLNSTAVSTVLGGLFYTPPTGTAAVVADNGSVAANIFEARDNGVSKVSIRDGGQLVFSTTTPSVANTSANSCGTTAATIAGTNETGIVTVGATSGTSCTVTFSNTAPTRRQCSVNNETTAALARATYSSTTVSIFAGTFVAGDVLAYQCSVY